MWPWSRIRELTHQRNDAHTDAKHIAWMCRASFERGYRSSRPDTEPNEWRESWRMSPERATLVKMGYINEEDTWR